MSSLARKMSKKNTGFKVYWESRGDKFGKEEYDLMYDYLAMKEQGTNCSTWTMGMEMVWEANVLFIPLSVGMPNSPDTPITLHENYWEIKNNDIILKGDFHQKVVVPTIKKFGACNLIAMDKVNGTIYNKVFYTDKFANS